MCEEHGLSKAIIEKWGSVDNFMKEMKEATLKN